MTYKSGEQVTITKGKRTTKAVRTAAEKVWVPRGWKIVEEKVAGTDVETGTKANSADEKKEEAK